VTDEAHEAKCLRCGKCCLAKCHAGNSRVYVPELPCRFLRDAGDGKTECSVYPVRKAMMPSCSNIMDLVKDGWAPYGCGYIPWRKGITKASEDQKARIASGAGRWTKAVSRKSWESFEKSYGSTEAFMKGIGRSLHHVPEFRDASGHGQVDINAFDRIRDQIATPEILMGNETDQRIKDNAAHLMDILGSEPPRRERSTGRPTGAKVTNAELYKARRYEKKLPTEKYYRKDRKTGTHKFHPQKGVKAIPKAQHKKHGIPPTASHAVLIGKDHHEHGKYSHAWIQKNKDGSTKHQRRKTKGFAEERHKAKFDNLSDLSKRIHTIRSGVHEDHGSKDAKTRALALASKMTSHHSFRSGGKHDPKQTTGLGLMNLRKEHFAVGRGHVRVRFKGKKGKQWNVKVDHPEIVKHVKKKLSEIKSPKGHFWHELGDGAHKHLLKYHKRKGMVTRDHRTFNATRIYANHVKSKAVPKDAKSRARIHREGVKAAAAHINDTPRVARVHYIDHEVQKVYKAGQVKFGKRIRGLGKAFDRLDELAKAVAALKPLGQTTGGKNILHSPHLHGGFSGWSDQDHHEAMDAHDSRVDKLKKIVANKVRTNVLARRLGRKGAYSPESLAKTHVMQKMHAHARDFHMVHLLSSKDKTTTKYLEAGKREHLKGAKAGYAMVASMKKALHDGKHWTDEERGFLEWVHHHRKKGKKLKKALPTNRHGTYSRTDKKGNVQLVRTTGAAKPRAYPNKTASMKTVAKRGVQPSLGHMRKLLRSPGLSTGRKKAILGRIKALKSAVLGKALKGGLADGMTVRDVAKKHKVPVAQIQKQLRMGAAVELEHTGKSRLAMEIAMDHLAEMPDYYTRLKKMEKVKKAEAGEAIFHPCGIDTPGSGVALSGNVHDLIERDKRRRRRRRAKRTHKR
jgi:DNA topoisomerase-1